MYKRIPMLLLIAGSLCAQPKPTVPPADYGKFENLGTATLSADGKWIAYEIRRVNGDNELRVSAASGGAKVQALANCGGAAFSADSRWLACEAGVSETEQERARKASRTLQNKLDLLELSSMKTTTVDDVQAFAFAGEGAYVAFRKYNAAAGGGGRGAAAATPAPGGRGGRGGGAQASETERDPTGYSLVVRDLATNVDATFGNVTNYAWQDKGSALAMTIGVENRVGNALQIFDPKSGLLKVLDSGPALFAALSWRKDSSDLAALRSVKQDGYEGESYIALAWKNLGEKHTTKIDAPKRIVPSRAPQWSEDGSIVYVGIAEWPKKIEVKKSDDDLPTVEVWH